MLQPADTKKLDSSVQKEVKEEDENVFSSGEDEASNANKKSKSKKSKKKSQKAPKPLKTQPPEDAKSPDAAVESPKTPKSAKSKKSGWLFRKRASSDSKALKSQSVRDRMLLPKLRTVIVFYNVYYFFMLRKWHLKV